MNAQVSHPLSHVQPVDVDLDLYQYDIINALGIAIGSTSGSTELSLNSTGTTDLHIWNTGTGDAQMHFKNPAVGDYTIGADDDANDFFKITGSQELGSEEVMYFDTAYKVGIGTPSPSVATEVYGNVSADYFLINGTSAQAGNYNPNNPLAVVVLNWLSDLPRFRYAGTGPGTSGGVKFQTNNGYVHFMGNGDLNISGTLTIGNTAAQGSANLEVYGSSGTYGTAVFEPDASKGSEISYVHYGSTGDWIINSASTSGGVYIQDNTGSTVWVGNSTTGDYVYVLLGSDRIEGVSKTSGGNGIWGQSDTGNGVVGQYGSATVSDQDAGVAGFSLTSSSLYEGVYGSGYYGLYGNGVQYGCYASGTLYAAWANTPGATAAVRAQYTTTGTGTSVESWGNLWIHNGGLCIDDTTGCAYNTADDGMLLIQQGLLCVNDDSGSSCSNPTYNSAGDLMIADGSLCIDWASSNCDDAARSDGVIYAQYTTITSVDLAEMYPAKQKLEPGDVLVVASEAGPICISIDYDGNKSCNAVDDSIVPFVAKSSEPYQQSVIGVYSEEPGIILGGFANMNYMIYDQVPVALAGRVPVKVTDENGPIQAGDLLTTSSKPGYAMKFISEELPSDFEGLKRSLSIQNKKRNTIIGKALEPFTEHEGKVLALVTNQ